jgi:hypothetical protein
MVQGRQHSSFALQLLESLGLPGQRRGQHPDGEASMKLGVSGPVNLAIPPAPSFDSIWYCPKLSAIMERVVSPRTQGLEDCIDSENQGANRSSLEPGTVAWS